MTEPTIVNTRGALRLATLEAVRSQLAEFLTPLDPEKPDGLEVVSEGHINEALERVKASPLPPIDVGSAEVKTPADVFVDAICPDCNLPTRILVELTSVLETTREAGSTIKVKGKFKGKTHVHHQLSLEIAVDQEQLGLDGAVDGDDDDSELLPGLTVLPTVEDEDLRPTGEVNADALRGEADRSVDDSDHDLLPN